MTATPRTVTGLLPWPRRTQYSLVGTLVHTNLTLMHLSGLNWQIPGAIEPLARYLLRAIGQGADMVTYTMSAPHTHVTELLSPQQSADGPNECLQIRHLLL